MKIKLLTLMLLALGLSSLLPADDFQVAGGWNLGIDADYSPSYFKDSDIQAKSDGYNKLLLNSGWNSAKTSFTNTPGLFAGGVSIGYDIDPHLSQDLPEFYHGWSALVGGGYRYYAGPEALITANAYGSSGYYLSGTEDETAFTQNLYLFAQPTYHFNAHHAIFGRLEAGVSQVNFEDKLSFYNSSTNRNSSFDETASGVGLHDAVFLGYQFTPWRHFTFTFSTGLHFENINQIYINTVNTNNFPTNDKSGDVAQDIEGNTLTENITGIQQNISASFIW